VVLPQRLEVQLLLWGQKQSRPNQSVGSLSDLAKSEGNGVLENEAPASKTIGSGFGWSSGTESETVGAKESTVGVGATVAKESTVAMATEVVGVGEWMSPMRVSN